MNWNGVSDGRSRIEIDELPAEIGIKPHNMVRVYMAVHNILTMHITKHLQNLPTQGVHMSTVGRRPHRMQEMLLFGDRERPLFESSSQSKAPRLKNEARREAVRIRQDFDESTQTRRFDAMRFDAMRFDAMRFDAMRFDAIRSRRR